MDKFNLKKRIKEMIQYDSELKQGYDALSKNKIGYMINKVREYCDSHDNQYSADTVRYAIANSDENAKEAYSNIINYKLKTKMRKTFNGISDADFDSAMREVLDDLADEPD